MDDFRFKLNNWFSNKNGILTALSGGVDSCLVAWAARQALPKEKAIALIGDSPSLKRRDLHIAKQFCEDNDIEYKIIYPNEILDPNYKNNPHDRCFWCKSSLYTVMKQYRDKYYPGFVLVNGNNKSDLGDYRPGLKAAGRYEAFSPLADCEMTKNDVRKLAEEAGLKVWNKPASPCLSSRLPYGETITVEKLSKIEKAEEIIANMGFSDARVRYYGEKASIEVPQPQIQNLRKSYEEISKQFKDLGFVYTQIDEEGLVSGKLNRLIGK